MRLRSLISIVAMTLAPALGGCATQQELDNTREANRALQQRIVELEQSSASWQQQVEVAQSEAAQARSQLAARDQMISRLTSELEQAGGEYDRLMNELNQIDPVMLPAEVDRALRNLAARYPELMTYDPQRGMIRLASDLTFDLGSAEVRSEARETIRQLAGVLNNEQVNRFEIIVAGHTDNVPIRRAETLAKHPTNVHLSAHRAIAVRDVLVEAGVAEPRIGVMGWGAHHPVVPNAAGGARENRRVEIFVRPSTWEGEQGQPAPGNAAPTTTDAAAPASRTDEPMK